MKKSAFISLFLLASLPALMSRGGSRRGGRFRPSSDGKEFLDLGTALRLRGHGDVPTLRAGSFARPAQVERTVVAYDPRNAGASIKRYFASVRHDLSQSVASLQPDAHRPLPSHSADYLKFGILVI